MEIATYDELYEKATGHFQAGEYGTALTLLSDHAGRFPQERAMIDYLRSCAAVRVDNSPLALEILQKALSDGLWYSEHILRSSPSYAPLQGTPDFELLVKGHLQLRGETAGETSLETTVPAEGTTSPFPLLLALHGNSSSPANEKDSWGQLADQGWLVAMPQSSQVLWAGARSSIWTDHETAARELHDHYDHLSAEYPLDPTRLVVAGFSMGGEIAIWLALRGEFTVRGFVALGPGGGFMDDPEQWQPVIEAAGNRQLRGVIMLGKDDNTIPHDAIEQLVKMLKAGGIATKLVKISNLRHEFPADFGKRLREAVEWIIEER
jgi:dienelactone hydrolase